MRTICLRIFCPHTLHPIHCCHRVYNDKTIHTIHRRRDMIHPQSTSPPTTTTTNNTLFHPSLSSLPSLHILLTEIDQNAAHRALPRLGPADGHVGIHRVLRSVGGIIAVGEAYFEGRGRVAHEERSAGHVGDAVGIGMGEFEEFGFRFPQQPNAPRIGTSPLGIESSSQFGRAFQETIAIDHPTAKRFERFAIESCHLLVVCEFHGLLTNLIGCFPECLVHGCQIIIYINIYSAIYIVVSGWLC